ncbi:MAG TPA: sulfotransferase [Candidatus Solibacter sp.]|nr:sulfotransferase [Candidatus Solibacter sp.]
MPRNKAPVFVVGCPRSGTTLLYNMLLSSGDFAVYLAESNVFNLLDPRFGDLGVEANRERLIDAWLNSKLFRASFLDEKEIREALTSQCKDAGDFLRIVMGEMARAQGVRRWADNSPEELLHARRIKKTLSDALFVHMIRDGRDVALSLDARPHKWVRPFSWDRIDSLLVTGLFWEWMVQKGRQECVGLRGDSIEVRFEDLQSDPHGTLKRVGDFIDHDLDYERILKVGIGSVSEPNTSFKGDSGNPAGRWKKKMTPETLARFEQLVGTTLGSLGYELASEGGARSLADTRMRALYRAYFDAKFWFKNSSLGRLYLGPMSGQQIDDTVIATDPAIQVSSQTAQR